MKSPSLVAVRRPITKWPPVSCLLRTKALVCRIQFSLLTIAHSCAARCETAWSKTLSGKCAARRRTGWKRLRWPSSSNPDLIVLDLSMPGMNGFEVARELKHITPSIPVLMFTSFKTPALESEALAAGCNAVVSKSEHQQMLFDNIQRLLTPKIFGRSDDSRIA